MVILLVYPANNGKWVDQYEITDPKMHPEWKDRLDQDAKRRDQLINKIKDNSQTVYFIQPHNGKNGYSIRFETKGPLERDKNTRKYYLAGFRSKSTTPIILLYKCTDVWILIFQ